ncbi:MAG TPA: imidazole glycerol phosphate synthase subunit HisH [Gemmatimonadaceae bacterium]|jgi:glutamine amidotransferase
MKVAILDYGAGNLHSLSKAVTATGAEVRIESDPSAAVESDALMLPGVGAFASATDILAPHREVLSLALRRGLPCLGICLGMQLLFDTSEEGPGKGLGLIPGHVRKLKAKRVPQIGWNSIDETGDSLFEVSPLSTAYFANSYVCEPDDSASVIAWATHDGDRFVAAARSGNVVGVQFHPEKSSAAGRDFIRAFLESAHR